MSNPVTPGYEAKLQFAAGLVMPAPSGTGAWTDLADVVDLKPNKVEAEDIDSSTMQSEIGPDGKPWKTFDPGWATAGEFEAKLHFSKAQNATIYNQFRVKQCYQIVFIDGSVWQSKGYLKTFANEVEREKLVQADVTVKLSGVPNFIPAP